VTLIALALPLRWHIGGRPRVYGGRFASPLAAAYSTIVRAVPVVVIIFILFLVIAKFIDLSPFLAGALALGLASGAYQSEIFRWRAAVRAAGTNEGCPRATG
jgi:polar amino acid transport system permease protein